MTVNLQDLDAHEQPSDQLRATWKSYYRSDHGAFVDHPDVDDFHIPEKAAELHRSGVIPAEKLALAFRQIEGPDWNPNQELSDAPIYFHPLMPGMSNTNLPR